MEQGTQFAIAGARLPDNPVYVARQIHVAQAQARAIRNLEDAALPPTLRGQVDTARRQLLQVISSLAPEGGNLVETPKEGIAGKLLARAFKQDAAVEAAGLAVDQRTAVWALGMVALETFTGKLFPDVKGGTAGEMSRIADRLADFGKNPFNVAVAPRNPDGSLPPGALAQATGIKAVDDFLNWMLDPTNTPNIDDVLRHPMMNQAGIDSDAVDQLTLALIGNDPNKDALVDQGKTALQRAIDLENNPPPLPSVTGVSGIENEIYLQL